MAAGAALMLAWGCGAATEPTPSGADGSVATPDASAHTPDSGQPAPDLPPGTSAGLSTIDTTAPKVTRTATFALG